MKQQIENIIKKNLPKIQEHICGFNDGECVCNCFQEALSQIDTALIADEVLKITKCDCCDEKDEHIFKDDRSTTRISRPCGGCGEHQTIAGALLKSKEWKKWYEYAFKNMLFDVDETLTVDAMSDKHWNSFMGFLADEVLKVVVEKIKERIEISEMLIEASQGKDNILGADGFTNRVRIDSELAIKVAFEELLSNLSPNKENN